jgi:hypothetical protein
MTSRDQRGSRALVALHQPETCWLRPASGVAETHDVGRSVDNSDLNALSVKVRSNSEEVADPVALYTAAFFFLRVTYVIPIVTVSSHPGGVNCLMG